MQFPIQMYDPKRDYQLHKTNIDNAIHKVLDHGFFIKGPEVKELEKKLAQYVGVKHCIAVSNGTDALKIALFSLGIKTGDEVITVAHSWISTAEVIPLVGANPVFVEIDNITFNMDLDKIEDKITKKTKAIIIVSLYCQMPNLNTLSKKYNLPVIEDGAQSFGALLNNKKSCSLTTIGTTSFFPSKPLGCFGDGGACFTNDDELAMKIRAISNHGGTKRFHHTYIGLNARLDTIQASILLEKFKYFEDSIIKRNRCANYYSEKLKNVDLQLPKILENRRSVWAQYSILAKDTKTRDNIVSYLKKIK